MSTVAEQPRRPTSAQQDGSPASNCTGRPESLRKPAAAPGRRPLQQEQARAEQAVARVKFHEGQVGEFKRLSARAMEIARAKDTGTLQYEIYVNDDQSEAVILERYRDSEAVIEHAAHVGDLMEAIFATGSGTSELLGEPSAELTAMTAGSGLRLFKPFLSI